MTTCLICNCVVWPAQIALFVDCKGWLQPTDLSCVSGGRQVGSLCGFTIITMWSQYLTFSSNYSQKTPHCLLMWVSYGVSFVNLLLYPPTKFVVVMLYSENIWHCGIWQWTTQGWLPQLHERHSLECNSVIPAEEDSLSNITTTYILTFITSELNCIKYVLFQWVSVMFLSITQIPMSTS